MIELNVDRLIDQLCAANHTNGQMMAELESAREEIKSLKETNFSLCAKVKEMENDLKRTQDSVTYWFDEARKAKEKCKEGENADA